MVVWQTDNKCLNKQWLHLGERAAHSHVSWGIIVRFSCKPSWLRPASVHSKSLGLCVQMTCSSDHLLQSLFFKLWDRWDLFLWMHGLNIWFRNGNCIWFSSTFRSWSFTSRNQSVSVGYIHGISPKHQKVSAQDQKRQSYFGICFI